MTADETGTGAPPTAENLLFTIEAHATRTMEAWGQLAPYGPDAHQLFDELRAVLLERWQAEHAGDPEWAEGLALVEESYRLLEVLPGREGVR